ncbi:hypothetical protein JCM11491_005238 [Sporobolomyces phaffii]
MTTCTSSRTVPTGPARASKAPAPVSSGAKSITQSPAAKTFPPPHVPRSKAASSASGPPTGVAVGGLTPSIEAIWKSFVDKGHDDVELLKLLLLTKSKEDERLTALDTLKTEQLRAANTMALHQYFYQYSAFYAAQQQAQQLAQQQQQHQQSGGSTRAPSPYSPTSPPPSSTVTRPSTKRPRAPSDASVGSNDSSVSASSASSPALAPAPTTTTKKPRLAPSTKNASSKSPPPPPPPAHHKHSHADVMELLRRKCQANQTQSGGSPSPPAAAAASTTSSAAAAARSTKPPSASPPLRHSLLLRPALPVSSSSGSSSHSPPPSLQMPQVQPQPNVLSPVVEESRARGGVDRLAMLLRAGEMKAESD